MSFVQSTRRASRYGSHVRAVATRYACEFFRRHAITGAHETVKAIAASSRIDVSIRENRYRLRRIVKRWIEVGEVVRLRVNRQTILIAHAELETELPIDFPTVSHKSFCL